eukprot:TRINITY_DN3897_c0_g1_i1.p1 TRINITY_DN3897_c0_g1~~TRINITY_DN3897_c0_g1_i1.p1  ORF type:complete len:220 (-),score=54.40 TRINITY_DN3897_c0_g1_i1:232-795(-)
MIESEGEYIKNLTILNEMKEYLEHDSLDLEKEVVTNIFGNSSVLCEFHTKILQEIKDSENVPATFLQYVTFFKLYNEYMAQYDQSLETILQLEENDVFQSYLDLFFGKYKKTLRSLILFPVKRVHQYQVSFESHKAHTKRNHPNYATLDELCMKIEEVARHITESQKNRRKYVKTQINSTAVGGQID